MNKGKYVFAQITDFLPQRIFDRLVEKHQGNKRVRELTCRNQLLCMIFGQLSNRDSLRDLIVTIQAHQSKSYHLGFGKGVHLSTLAVANIRRSYKIYEEFAGHLIAVARKKNAISDFEVNVDGNVYAFDSSMIDVCLNVFWWATYKRNAGGVKLHTLYDVKTHIPCFVHITAASVNDIIGMDKISYEQDSFYVFDRGYNDFERLYRIHIANAFFVFRARDKTKFRRIYSNKVDKSTGVKTDQIGIFTVWKSHQRYPEKIRRIKYIDSETKKEFIFLTNNFKLQATDIALLYKNRWHIELFFKWIKQHLKIKTFWGHTQNAVKTQVYCDIITYCLISILAKELKIDRSIYEILQILGISLLDKTPVKELLINTDYKNVKELNYNILLFNDF